MVTVATSSPLQTPSSELPAPTYTRQTQWVFNDISTVPTSSTINGLIDWAIPEQVSEGGPHIRGQDADGGLGRVGGHDATDG